MSQSDDTDTFRFSRRAFCVGLIATWAAGTPLAAHASVPRGHAAGVQPSTSLADPGKGDPRRLDIRFLETGEHFSGPYFDGSAYDLAALQDLSVVLGDRRTGECHPIDPRILDIAWRISRGVADHSLTCLSGFRSPKTNKKVGGAPHSFHMTGQALDIWLPRRALARQVRVARKLGGGVGRYRNFIHIDSGPSRLWTNLAVRHPAD